MPWMQWFLFYRLWLFHRRKWWDSQRLCQTKKGVQESLRPEYRHRYLYLNFLGNTQGMEFRDHLLVDSQSVCGNFWLPGWPVICTHGQDRAWRKSILEQCRCGKLKYFNYTLMDILGFSILTHSLMYVREEFSFLKSLQLTDIHPG